MIAIIDYGLGNIRAFLNLYKKLDISAKTVSDKASLNGVSKLILPGVGAFDHAIKSLNKSGMRDALDNIIMEAKIPVLGICVGMQIMAKRSEEGSLSGLGWINSDVIRFNEATIKFKPHLPHMGWNDIESTKDDPLFNDLIENPRFYFLHSYHCKCNEPDDEIAVAKYGEVFTCAFHHKNIYGIQFHPEKSHFSGIQLLKNFASIKCSDQE